MIKNIFGKLRNMFTTANDNGQNDGQNVNNNGTTADVINNANGTTTDGQSTTPVAINPVTIGTTPELRDGSGVVCPERPLTREELNEQLATDLATCKRYVKLYTEQLAETTDKIRETVVRDRLTFWQNERETVNGKLAVLTDNDRSEVTKLFTDKINVLNGQDNDTLELADTKSATFAYNNAKKRCDDQKSVVKTANDNAKTARDLATAERERLNNEQLTTAELAVLSGNANDNDRSLLARRDVIDNANDTLTAVFKKLFAKRQSGSKLLRNATDKLRSLSAVCKNVVKNFVDFVPYFELYDVNVKSAEITPNVVKSENVHPFMLVPTIDGLKVCDPTSVGRSLQPLTRWTEEKLCQLIVLNHYLKLENVSSDRLNVHVVLLNTAVEKLQVAKDKKDTAQLTNARCEELTKRLAVLADPDKTPDDQFDVKLYVQLTNDLADEKRKLREQLAEQRTAQRQADNAKKDVKNDTTSDVINNARSERDNVKSGNDQKSDVKNDTTPVLADDQKSDGTKSGNKKSNGTKSGNKKSNGTTASRTRTTASRSNKKNDTKSTTPVLADGTNGK